MQPLALLEGGLLQPLALLEWEPPHIHEQELLQLLACLLFCFYAVAPLLEGGRVGTYQDSSVELDAVVSQLSFLEA